MCVFVGVCGVKVLLIDKPFAPLKTETFAFLVFMNLKNVPHALL